MREKLKMAKLFGNWLLLYITFAKLVHAQSFCIQFSFRGHITKLYIVLNKVTCIIIQQKIKNNFLKVMNHGISIAY